MRFLLGVLLGLALAYAAHELIVKYSAHGLPPNYESPKGFVKIDGVMQFFPPYPDDLPIPLEDAA